MGVLNPVGVIMRRAIFLDRDGVLNKPVLVCNKPYPPSNLSELEIYPGVQKSCAQLHQAGFLLVVVTNQPDVARGKQKVGVVEKINRELMSLLPLDSILVCYHDDADACTCRKPSPGMLIKAQGLWEIDLSRSFIIGDTWRDIAAGAAVGCRTILLVREYAIDPIKPPPNNKFKTLLEATEWILNSI